MLFWDLWFFSDKSILCILYSVILSLITLRNLKCAQKYLAIFCIFSIFFNLFTVLLILYLSWIFLILLLIRFHFNLLKCTIIFLYVLLNDRRKILRGTKSKSQVSLKKLIALKSALFTFIYNFVFLYLVFINILRFLSLTLMSRIIFYFELFSLIC